MFVIHNEHIIECKTVGDIAVQFEYEFLLNNRENCLFMNICIHICLYLFEN